MQYAGFIRELHVKNLKKNMDKKVEEKVEKKIEDMTVTELKALAFDMNNQLQVGVNRRNEVLELIENKLKAELASAEVVSEDNA